MKQDYLWDGSGEPDPEVQKLEEVLGRLRHRSPVPVFPELTRPASRWFPRSLAPRWAFAAAALVVAVAGIMLLRDETRVIPSEWNVTRAEGSAQVGGQSIIGEQTGNLGVGQVVETGAASKASIRAEETGEIELEPRTRLHLVRSINGVQRLALERGTIHATIWAEPGKFVVDTPSAVAVDLGCVYTLHVDDSGDGLLRTTVGWVGFKLAGREAFIPAGAACPTRKNTGPGIPYFEDASTAFRDALAQLDGSAISDQERAAALRVVLSESRQRDALSLWHLLARVPAADRGAVYNRLAQLVSPDAAVTREGILKLDPAMLDLWWNELGLGDVSLWRHWERGWKF
ncbi:MAG TPA: FecR domain-containing protein [Terriglobales bacterium]